MYLHYFYWQYIAAPRWLLQFFWHLQLAVINLFSVPLMLRTLFAHWRRDITAYTGSLTDRLKTLAFNLISRGIGFIIRSTILGVWVVAEGIFLVSGVIVFLFFLFWPVIVIGGLTLSAQVLFGGVI